MLRLLLRLYPPSFRRRFEEGMVEAWESELEDARARGPLAVSRLRVATALHLLAGAPGEWWAAVVPAGGLLQGALGDVRYALRGLASRPGFTVVVVAMLGLGIGANTAIFSVLDAVLLRPLPFDEPEDLAFVWGRMESTSVDRAPLSGPDLVDLRERSEQFESLAAVFSANSTLSGDYEAEQIRLGNATINLFDVMGVEPVLGRGFQPGDAPDLSPSIFNDPLTTPPPTVAVLGWDLWQRRYGGDESVLGRSVLVNGQSVVIVGVAPRGFRLYLPADASIPGDVDLWSPVATRVDSGPRDAQWLVVIGRKRAGASWDAVRAEMDAIATRLREEHQFHANVGMHLLVAPMHAAVVEHVQPILVALLGAVAFVLLIACANVANLLLVRAGAREREIAVRRALGGGRARILRQMITESLVIAVAGGVAGVLIALGGIELLEYLRPAHLPRSEAVALDGRILVGTATISFFAALLFGAAPALQAARLDPGAALHQRGGTAGRRRTRLRDGLVVAEVALSLVLLIGAGLMLRTFGSLQRIDPGFDPEHVLTVTVTPPFFKYRSNEERVGFLREVHDALAAVPGTEVVGGVAPLPLAGGGQLWFGPFALTESEDEWSRNEGDYRVHVPGYFEAVGIRLLRGRTLTLADSEPDADPVIVIDETMARRGWPDEDPLGRRLLVMRPDMSAEDFQFERYWATVVGVVEHVRYDDLRSTGRETIYFPMGDWSFAEIVFTLKTAGDPASIAADARAAVLSADPDVAPGAVRPFADYVADAFAQVRFALVLIAFFAVTALILSTVGLYGVVSFSVAQRTREIGVRMAFGAERKRIVGLVLGRSLVLVLAGIVLGSGGAVVLAGSLSTLLYGVSPFDPATFAGLALTLALVALVAAWLPARRATRIDPSVALQSE